MPSQIKIARMANVSQSVVSRVLSGRAKSAGIAEETILRVQEIATALGYKPNRAATMLLGHESKLVGVIVRSFEDQFLAAILKEVNARAVENGYTLLLGGLEYGESSMDEIERIPGYMPDGFIVIGTTDFKSWSKSFLNVGKPIIQIGLPTEDARVVTCGTDEEAAIQDLVRHLIELGHRVVGVIGDSTPASRIRASGIKAALKDAGLPIMLPFHYSSEAEGASAGRDAAHYFLQDTDRERWPTAVIAVSDVIALSFIRSMKDERIAVPEFLSVAGFGDVELASLAQPSLTTICQPAQSLAAAAMDMIAGVRPRVALRLAGVLKCRESTSKAR